MINRIKLKIPYPIMVGYISFNRKIEVEFSFDNLALFLFRENQKINNNQDFDKWLKEHTKYDYLLYMAYYAAQSAAMHNRKKFKLDLKRFAVGLSSMPEIDIVKLTECWKNSQEYGAETIPGKKKVEGRSLTIPNSMPI